MRHHCAELHSSLRSASVSVIVHSVGFSVGSIEVNTLCDFLQDCIALIIAIFFEWSNRIRLVVTNCIIYSFEFISGEEFTH